MTQVECPTCGGDGFFWHDNTQMPCFRCEETGKIMTQVDLAQALSILEGQRRAADELADAEAFAAEFGYAGL